MENAYVINYAGELTPTGDHLPLVLLKASRGDNSVFYFAVSMTGQAAIGFRDLEPEEKRRILLEAGVDELELGLRAGLYPTEHDGDYFERMYTSDEYDRLTAYRERGKECVWQDRRERGWICEATPPEQDERTTAALCAGCVIPDARVICAHLAHVSITMDRDATTGELRRLPHKAPLCAIGNDPKDGSSCRPGGLECWERKVEAGPERRDPPPDVARRAADEIDYFTLVFRDRYGGNVWKIPQARTISELFGDCNSAEDFQRRVAALADLLARLDPYPQLEEEERLDEAGSRVGSLVALERLMTRDHPEVVNAVKIMRLIPQARNAFPIHSGGDRLIQALRDLGADFPARDWRLAWLQVLTAFWLSVQELRVALQTAASANGD
jgi:hypothetical protein